MALASMTNDRFALGLGTSTPQIMEAWDGVDFTRPIRRTRELIEIIRLVESGERVEYDGRIHQIPLRGELRSMRTRSRTRRLPSFIASVGPQNLRLTGALADGWIGNCFVPETAHAFFDHLRAGAAINGRTIDDLELQVPVTLEFGDDLDGLAKRHAVGYAFTCGAMGEPHRNCYVEAFARQGFEQVREVHRRWLDGRRPEAKDLVPVELALKTNPLGTDETVKDRLRAYRDVGIHSLRVGLRGESIDEQPRDLGQLLDLVAAVDAQAVNSPREAGSKAAGACDRKARRRSIEPSAMHCACARTERRFPWRSRTAKTPHAARVGSWQQLDPERGARDRRRDGAGAGRRCRAHSRVAGFDCPSRPAAAVGRRMRVGVLSDTHIPEAGRDLPREVYDALRGCDAILHGGDITISRVLDRLEVLAPVYAAMGNHDEHLTGDPRVQAQHWLTFEGHEVALLHRFEPLDWSMDRLLTRFFGGRRPDVVVCGDTHFESIETIDGVLLVNAGSATLPRNLSPRLGHVAMLTLEAGRPALAELVDLSGGANDGLMRTGAESRAGG